MESDPTMIIGGLVFFLAFLAIVGVALACLTSVINDRPGDYTTNGDLNTNVGASIFATHDSTSPSPSRRVAWTPRSPLWTRTTSPLEGKRYGVDKKAVLRGKLQAGELFQ